MKRCQNTLKIAREIYPCNDPRVSSLLLEISDILCYTGKVEEAKPYAEELWEICKKQSPTSAPYILGAAIAMRVNCYFDFQASEDILVDILKRNWPHIYKVAASSHQRQVNVEEVVVDDGNENLIVLFLKRMLECFFAVSTMKVGKCNFSTSKLKFYIRIAEIKVCIQKSVHGEIHPNMEEAYECLKLVHVILGNENEVIRLQGLVVKCQQLVPGGNKPAHQTLLFNDNFMRTRRCKDCANVLFRKGNYLGALELYNQALSLSPNDAELQSNRAATCVKLSEQRSKEDKEKFLEQALQASQGAIAADPSWVKGYYWKAVCLAHLAKRGPSLAAAAVAKHLSSECAKIPAVVDRFGSYDSQIITTILDLLYATERRNARNVVIVMKEGRYELPSPVKIPKNAVMVGLGEVQIYCSKGVPLRHNSTVYMENISLYPTLEILKKEAKRSLADGKVDEALSLYSQALTSCPNNPQILTSRALTYLKSAELKKGNPSERRSVLELGLKDSEAAIKVDPTWLLGYYTKAASLAELDRKHQALAAAAVFKYLSFGRDVPGVTQRYGSSQVQVVETSFELSSVLQKIKKLEEVNQVVLIKNGEYLLERSVTISQQIVVVGQGQVTVSCKNGAPFCFTEACHVENVEIVANYNNENKRQLLD